MDILSHALWSSVAAKAANKKLENKIDSWRAGFWGAFPDLLAFTLLIFGIAWEVIFNGAALASIPRPTFIGQLTGFLYPLSHSFVTFLFVFLILFLFYKLPLPPSLKLRRPPWEMGGWGLHILLDISTHPEDGYPTRFLWPFSEFSVDGTTWRSPEFLIVDYLLLGLLFFLLRKEKGPAPFTPTRKVLTVLLVIIAVVSTYYTFGR